MMIRLSTQIIYEGCFAQFEFSNYNLQLTNITFSIHFICNEDISAHVRGRLGLRGRIMKVDFALSLVKSEVQVAL